MPALLEEKRYLRRRRTPRAVARELTPEERRARADEAAGIVADAEAWRAKYGPTRKVDRVVAARRGQARNN